MDGLRWLLLLFGLAVVAGVYLYSRKEREKPQQPASTPEREEPRLENARQTPTMGDEPVAAAVEPERPSWRRWWQQWTRGGRGLTDPKPLLSGREVADLLGLDEGPELGAAMHALVKAQVRGDVRTPAGANRWLRENDQTFNV